MVDIKLVEISDVVTGIRGRKNNMTDSTEKKKEKKVGKKIVKKEKDSKVKSLSTSVASESGPSKTYRPSEAGSTNPVQFDQGLIQQFTIAQELAKHEVRKKKRAEAMEKVEEDKINILNTVKISEIWAAFLKDLGVNGTFYTGRYKIPYRRMKDGTFMHIPGLDKMPNLEYKTYFKAGYTELRSSGRDVELLLGRSQYFSSFVGHKGGYYMVFDSGEDAGIISAIGALSIIRNNMRPFFDALVYYYSEKMNIEIGEVDTVGYDDIYTKAYKTLTCGDDRIGTRHILFAGEPGIGKSMLIKKLIQNKPKDVVILNIDVDHDWEQMVPFLNVLASGTGKFIWIIIDEIDEYGVHRDISFNKTFELMRLLDGVSKNRNVRFIASTNRPNSLDPALLRVGRFGPIFYIDKPTEEQKREIVSYYANKYGANVDIEKIVSETKNGFTGCDIRSAFESCIIYDEPLTTDNIVDNIAIIKKATQHIDKSYA